MPFHVYKKVLQLFFNLYKQANTENVTNYRSLLNNLLNHSKNQFASFKNNPDRAGKPHFREFLDGYSHERDDYLIAGNALLTLLRSGALTLVIAQG